MIRLEGTEKGVTGSMKQPESGGPYISMKTLRLALLLVPLLLPRLAGAQSITLVTDGPCGEPPNVTCAWANTPDPAVTLRPSELTLSPNIHDCALINGSLQSPMATSAAPPQWAAVRFLIQDTNQYGTPYKSYLAPIGDANGWYVGKMTYSFAGAMDVSSAYPGGKFWTVQVNSALHRVYAQYSWYSNGSWIGPSQWIEATGSGYASGYHYTQKYWWYPAGSPQSGTPYFTGSATCDTRG